MADQIYKLLVCDIEIGSVRQRDADFPNVWGDFEPAPEGAASPMRSRINGFVEHMREYSRLLSVEGQDGGELDRFYEKHGSDFVDLIECDDWSLVDATGLKHPILAPIFDESGVIWRWA